ncbi:MAG: hypothetical protein ACI3YG_07720 [Prevotella sp.]
MRRRATCNFFDYQRVTGVLQKSRKQTAEHAKNEHHRRRNEGSYSGGRKRRQTKM